MIDLNITPADGPEVKLAKATLMAMRMQAVPAEVQAEAAAIMLAALTAEACLGKPYGAQVVGIQSARDLFETWLARMQTMVSN